jgi:uncharacterized protein YecE (DUF72 family)
VKLRVGCSGWVYKDWRGAFYPEGLAQSGWLEHYATVFDTVEVNNTFYRLPTEAAVRGWVARTPPEFLFVVKGSRYTTHIKRLIDFDKYSQKFFRAIEPLADANKLGAVLWQLAPNFAQDLDRLEAALSVLTERPGPHAFEFRHPSWFDPATYELLRERGVALVIGDDPRWPFQARELTTAWTYVRLHRGVRGRRGNYSRRELETWSDRIAGWREAAGGFVFFNNDWEAFAPANALDMRALIKTHT